jgi:NADH:ubiquinone oxidoreductase subunit 5 (subunit L)/multisubunit Na+/H+ antiporter MnhA subunit
MASRAASADVMHHVHESPPVMLVPLYVLATGALLAGVVFYTDFTGHAEGDAAYEGWYNEFWRTALVAGAGKPHPGRVPPRAVGVKLSPFVAMLLGTCHRLVLLYPLAADAEGARRAQHQGLYKFLLNKWYFDELYDFICSSAVRSASARFLWKQGDGWLIDGFGPNGIASRVRQDDHRPGYPAADRIPLSLRVRDADRRCSACHVDDARECILMADWPLLSVVTFHAADRRAVSAAIKDDSEIARRNIRHGRSCLTTASPSSCRC